MMELYAVKDVLVGYMNPFVMLNQQQAVRAFSHTVNSKQPNPIQDDMEHMQLWRLGTFDELTGVLVSKPEMIVDALSVYLPVSPMERVVSVQSNDKEVK